MSEQAEFTKKYLNGIYDARNYEELHEKTVAAMDRIYMLHNSGTYASEPDDGTGNTTLEQFSRWVGEAVVDWVVETESPDGEDGT